MYEYNAILTPDNKHRSPQNVQDYKKLIIKQVFAHYVGQLLLLARVFHCVNHDTLLYKLNFCRVIGKDNEWMKSYLTIGIKEWR